MGLTAKNCILKSDYSQHAAWQMRVNKENKGKIMYD